MRRLEPGEGRNRAGDGAGLRATLEDVAAGDLAAEVGAELRTQLEVFAHVDPQHRRNLALLDGGGHRIVVGREKLATSCDVEAIAEYVTTHEGAADLVVGRDIVEGLDVVDVQVEAERRAEGEGANEVQQEAQIARRGREAGLRRLLPEVGRRD